MIEVTASEASRTFYVRIGAKLIGKVECWQPRFCVIFVLKSTGMEWHSNGYRTVQAAAKALLESQGYGEIGRQDVNVTRLTGVVS